MAIKPDWTQGLLTLTAGSKTFTTTDSALQAVDIQGGDEIITASGALLVIDTITGQNSGTLYEPCPPMAAGFDQPLRVRYQPDGSRLPAATRHLINLLSSGNLMAFAELVGGVDKVPYFTGAGVMDLIDLASLGGGGTGGGSWDALTGTLAGRDAFNSEAEGFRVLVANNGNGQAVIYQKTGSGAADWSMPVPFTGAKGNDGPPNALTVGTVTEGEQAHVSITGVSPNQKVNFVLRRGEKGETGDVTPEALAAKEAAEAAAVQTGLDKNATADDRVATGADKAATTADRVATAADRVATGGDRTAAATSASTASTKASEAAADRIQTGLDRTATGVDRAAVASDKTATGADRIATADDRIATGQDKAATATSAAAALANKNATDTAKDQAVNAAGAALSAADTSAGNAAETASDKVATAADRVATGSDKTAAAASAIAAATQAGIATAKAGEVVGSAAATAADRVVTGADKAAAEAARTGSETARDFAHDWSSAGENVPVDDGEHQGFSSYHYSIKARDAAGGGVTSLNGKVGSVFLTEGSNITITDTGTALEISSTGEAQVQTDWNATSGIASIKNRPTIPTTAADVGAAPASIVSDVEANTLERHSHSNKAILDATTASFLTAEKTKLSGTEVGAQKNPNMALYQAVSDKNQFGGYAGLGADGKLDESLIPAVAITDTFVVANQAAMLALVAERGDVAIREDVSKTFILQTEPASVLANWKEMRVPASGVQSVGVAVPTGFSVSGPITSTGTITITYAAGFQGYTAAEANKLIGILSGADKTTSATVGAALAGPTPSTTLNDGDKIGGILSGGAVLATWSWATIKAGIKALTDTLYASKAQGGKADTAVQPAVMNTALADKQDKAAQAADSAKLEGKTAALLPISTAAQAALDGKAGFYTGSDASEVNFPIGHPISLNIGSSAAISRNQLIEVYIRSDFVGGYISQFYSIGSRGARLSGTWRITSVTFYTAADPIYLIRRVS